MTSPVVCFLLGTNILTPDGEKKIETLQIGDKVTAASGAAFPIKWIGRMGFKRSVDNWPEHVLPVRIKHGALGEEIPHRDLLVSPNHALLIDGELHCAKDIVNGDTIISDASIDTAYLLYFHIELEHHEILIADGAPAESLYADAERRENFSNFAEFERLYPGEGREAPERCAPLAGSKVVKRSKIELLREALVKGAAAKREKVS